MEIIKPLRGIRLDKSHPLNRGLVACYLFNEGDGKIVQDLSGNGNHGTIHNMAFPPTAASGWNAGRRGTALDFDGANDYVEITNNPSLNFGVGESFSVQAWVKFAGSDASQTIYRSSTASAKFILERRSGGLVRFQIRGTNVTSTTNINDGNYHHILGIRNGSTGVLSLYIDGVSEGTPTGTDTGSVTDTANHRIGARQNDTELFNGIIDEVRIYNRVLSAEEIKQLYLYPYGK